MYTFNDKTKRINFQGNDLTRDELVTHLNQMAYSLEACAFAWRGLHELEVGLLNTLDFLDGIFLGANAGLEPDDTLAEEVEDEGAAEGDTEI